MIAQKIAMLGIMGVNIAWLKVPGAAW